MRKIAIVAIAALIGTPALAADMAVKARPMAVPPPNWAGFYAGVNVGYGWGDNNASLSANDPAAAFLLSGAEPGGQPLANPVSVHQTGAVGGFEAGYNWQAGSNWLWGLEADISFSSLKGQSSATSLGQNAGIPVFLTTNVQQTTDWYGTVRGRVGWLATPNLLLFGTGGFAYGRESVSANIGTNGATVIVAGFAASGFECLAIPNSTCFGGAPSTAIKTGWTAGGGVEWLLSQRVSLKLEYQFIDLGTENVRITATAPAPGVPTPPLASFNVAFKDQIETARLGLNFHF